VYLDVFGKPDSYNTKCSKLTEDNCCSVWGTMDLPMECRTYVCQTREFSKVEISALKFFNRTALKVEDLSQTMRVTTGCAWCGQYPLQVGHTKRCPNRPSWWKRMWLRIYELVI